VLSPLSYEDVSSGFPSSPSSRRRLQGYQDRPPEKVAVPPSRTSPSNGSASLFERRYRVQEMDSQMGDNPNPTVTNGWAGRVGRYIQIDSRFPRKRATAAPLLPLTASSIPLPCPGFPQVDSISFLLIPTYSGGRIVSGPLHRTG